MSQEALKEAGDIQDDVQDNEEQDNQSEGHEEQQRDGQDTPEIRARRMGWKPKEEYKGKGEWVEAEAFLEKTENDPKHLRDSLRTIERNYGKLEKNVEAILEHHAREVEEKTKGAYDRAIADIEARLEQAIEDEDPKAIKKALLARDEIKERQQQAKPKPHLKSEPTVITDWKAKNTWFGKDPVLTDAAARYTDVLAKEGKSTEEQLAGAEKYVRETFPQKFRQSKDAPRMNGGGSNFHRDTTPKAGSYEALTSEARAECDRSVKGSNGKITKEDWLKYATPDMFKG